MALKPEVSEPAFGPGIP